jgi:hypothetical protein
MDERIMRGIIRDENNRNYRILKRDLKDIFITRKEYYEDQTGKPSGSKEKALFWAKLTGLITALTAMIGMGIAYISAKLP